MSISKTALLEKIEKLERRVHVLECEHNYTLVEKWKGHWTYYAGLFSPPSRWKEAGSRWRCTKCKHELLLGYSEKPTP